MNVHPARAPENNCFAGPPPCTHAEDRDFTSIHDESGGPLVRPVAVIDPYVRLHPSPFATDLAPGPAGRRSGGGIPPGGCTPVLGVSIREAYRDRIDACGRGQVG